MPATTGSPPRDAAGCLRGHDAWGGGSISPERALPNSERTHSEGRRRGAILDAELGVNLLQVLIHGARAEIEDFRNVAVGLAARDPHQHLRLALGERKLALEDEVVIFKFA